MKKFIIALLLLSSCGSKREQTEKAHAAEAFLNSADAKPTSPPACQLIAAFSLKGMIYSPELVSWGNAVNKAPQGKRLITRGEALLLWDSGAFKGVNFNIGQAWTASEKEDGDVYALNTLSGWLDYSTKDNELGAIYVDK